MEGIKSAKGILESEEKEKYSVDSVGQPFRYLIYPRDLGLRENKLF